MDDFLRDIHTSIFKQWILMYDNTNIALDQKTDNIIQLDSHSYLGNVTFSPLCIIELSVTNKITEETEFYLHFQMNTIKHAIELFHEMIGCIESLIEQPLVKILLSCSGGLTTSYFASLINNAFNLLHLNYNASAVAYTTLFNVGIDYDIILLAPQISYLQANVQNVFKDKTVISIPPQVFAKYDVGSIIKIIKENIEIAKSIKDKNIQKQTLSIKKSIHYYKKILVLSIIRNSNRLHILYRLYGAHQQIILHNEIIKNQFYIQDIYDVLDTVLTRYPDIEDIGISIPGIINQGFITSANIKGLMDTNMITLLKKRYKQNIILGNDVNTAAIGYYMTQSQYSNIVTLFQPSNFQSGAGIIINGQLILGKNSLAGEIQYLPMDLSDDRLVLCHTLEGAIELVAKTIISIISIVSPEIIVVFCTMIPDVDELIEEIGKYIPKQYIPEIITLNHLEEYTLLGQMVLCAQQYK